MAAAGDDSSNEDPAEEGDDKEAKSEHKLEAEGDDGGELPVIPEEGKVDAQEDEGSAEEEEEEDKEFSFPDTTISLSHLQPSR